MREGDGIDRQTILQLLSNHFLPMPSENSEVADTGVAVHQEYQDMTRMEESYAWALALA